jgi:hypothetical protein
MPHLHLTELIVDEPARAVRRDSRQTLDERQGKARTLISQQILSEPRWAQRLTAATKKALTALIWAHVNPYGTFHIDMNTHLEMISTVVESIRRPAVKSRIADKTKRASRTRSSRFDRP